MPGTRRRGGIDPLIQLRLTKSEAEWRPELLQPGEVKTVTIETPYNARMARNSYQFSHANGNVPKPARVTRLVPDPPKTPAGAAPATPEKK